MTDDMILVVAPSIVELKENAGVFAMRMTDGGGDFISVPGRSSLSRLANSSGTAGWCKQGRLVAGAS